jgi:diacylglycerol kinase family enzyme
VPDKIAVIVNPRSGSANLGSIRDELAGLFAAHDLAPAFHLLQAGEHAADAARKAVREGCRIVVAAGGDGTIGAAASAVAGSDAVLGVLPMGTFNHFAKDLGIPVDPAGAVGVIARGRAIAVDIAEVNGHIFINNSSLGIYPNIVTVRERQRRRHGRSKWLAFAHATLQVLRRSPFLRVRVSAAGESTVHQTPFVFVGNNEYKMEGLEIGTRTSIDQGRLFVYVAAPISRAGLVWMALSALFRHLDSKRTLSIFCVADTWIETRRRHVRVSTDGEVQRLTAPLHYRILPGALRVLAP